ncbi:MAG: hypothetical protein H0X16_12600, partial [Chloroflexi bacterium]|nr:hypothetical protein [Chloroflexota bacterium]
IVAAIVLVVGGAALVLLNNLISGPADPGVPVGQPGGLATAVPVLTAAPTGLTILSPTDGSVIRTKNLTVIGTAPAGMRVVRDITFGLDMSSVVDGTGHWALSFELAEGTNDLTFRLGDDRSTAQRIRVTYVEAPAAEPTPTQAMGSAPAIPTVGLPSMTPVIPDATPAPGATLAPGASIPPGQRLAILDPADGATLSNRSLRILGIAPPGARIVQDISFALDRSTTADAAGRWAIEVELRDGENLLTFRIGDDQSTKRTLRLMYQPPP